LDWPAARDDVAKSRSAVCEVIALDAKTVAAEFAFDEILHRGQVVLVAERAALTDNHFEIAVEAQGIDLGSHDEKRQAIATFRFILGQITMSLT
jgi:hypothetical protein